MALDPKRRAGWILDLLLRAFCQEFGLNLAIDRDTYNRLALCLEDLIVTTDPATAESELGQDRTIN